MLVNRSSSDENKTINDFSFSRDKRIHARCYIGNIIIFIIRERLKKKKFILFPRNIVFFFTWTRQIFSFAQRDIYLSFYSSFYFSTLVIGTRG